MAELECIPFAVGHADEGVCILIHMGPYRVLLDCGLRDLSLLMDGCNRSAKKDERLPNQMIIQTAVEDEANRQVGEATTPYTDDRSTSHPASTASIAEQAPVANLVFCSHAHADHARGLLKLHREYPHLPVYASHVTAQLLPLNWLDEDVPDFCTGLDWRSPIQIYSDLSLQIWPAGHLPGAASVLFTYAASDRTYTVFYTGDFLLSNSRLVDGLPLEEVRGLKPDVLIVEGSYGTARHPKRRQQENHLADKIKQAIACNHSVLLPTPMLGLGQELLMLLRSHHHFTGQPIDIWVAHRLAQACDAYLELISQFPSTVQNFARHQSLFWDERIRPFVKRLPPHPKAAVETLSKSTFPVIVLMDTTTSPEEFCRDEGRQWLLLLPHKFGQPSSVERSVYEQIQQSELLQQRIHSAHLTIDSYSLGDHCDGPGTTQLIHNIRPQHVVFVHGSPNHLTDLTSLEELQNRYHLHLPSADMRLELPVGDIFVQPDPPDISYEGELTELKTTALITLPKEIQHDERWQTFADTGIVEARWQGNELVIRGVQQPELLNQDRTYASAFMPECCDRCAFYRDQQCWNQRSPMFGFKVTPEGYCPEFKTAYKESEPYDTLSESDSEE